MLWATNLKQNHRQHCVEGLREEKARMVFTTQRDFRKGMRHSWMRSLLQVHLPNYTQTPAPASFLSIPQSPAPLLLLLLESRTSSRQLEGLQGAEQGGDEMEQSATPLHSSPGWAQRQGMRQQWTDFGKYNTVLKKDLAAWKISCVVQADRHTPGWNSGQGIQMMVESHWWQLSSSGPVCPASTLLWQLCQTHQCNKSTPDWWHLRALGKGNKEKGRWNIWGGADDDQKLRGRLEKQ